MADPAYGLWPLVVLNTVLFMVFAASFFHPRTGRDWRAMGAFTAFLVALFTEMYGGSAHRLPAVRLGRLEDSWAAGRARRRAPVQRRDRLGR
jgi:hypothetical protein